MPAMLRDNGRLVIEDEFERTTASWFHLEDWSEWHITTVAYKVSRVYKEVGDVLQSALTRQGKRHLLKVLRREPK